MSTPLHFLSHPPTSFFGRGLSTVFQDSPSHLRLFSLFSTSLKRIEANRLAVTSVRPFKIQRQKLHNHPPDFLDPYRISKHAASDFVQPRILSWRQPRILAAARPFHATRILNLLRYNWRRDYRESRTVKEVLCLAWVPTLGGHANEPLLPGYTDHDPIWKLITSLRLVRGRTFDRRFSDLRLRGLRQPRKLAHLPSCLD